MKYRAQQSKEKDIKSDGLKKEAGNVGVLDILLTPSTLDTAGTFLKYLIGRK